MDDKGLQLGNILPCLISDAVENSIEKGEDGDVYGAEKGKLEKIFDLVQFAI